MHDVDPEEFRMQYSSDMWALLDGVWQAWGELIEPPMAPVYQSQIFPAELWQNMSFFA